MKRARPSRLVAYSRASPAGKLEGMQKRSMPGDAMIDRHLPSITEEKREQARKALLAFGLALAELGVWVASQEVADSRDFSRCSILSQTPPESSS